MNFWNCMALGPTTQDHIDIIMGGWDKRTNWLHPCSEMDLRVQATSKIKID